MAIATHEVLLALDHEEAELAADEYRAAVERRRAEFEARKAAITEKAEVDATAATEALAETKARYVKLRDEFQTTVEQLPAFAREAHSARQAYIEAWTEARRLAVSDLRIEPLVFERGLVIAAIQTGV